MKNSVQQKIKDLSDEIKEITTQIQAEKEKAEAIMHNAETTSDDLMIYAHIMMWLYIMLRQKKTDRHIVNLLIVLLNHSRLIKIDFGILYHSQIIYSISYLIGKHT